MPYSINMNASQMEAARLEYPKALTHQSVYRYAATIAGAAFTEIFLDGLLNKRLQVPINCTALFSYDMVTYEFTTATGAFASGVSSLGGKVVITNNNGVVAAVANPVPAALSPSLQTVATLAVIHNDTFDAVTVSVNTTGALTTKVVELIATVTIANRAAAIMGLS